MAKFYRDVVLSPEKEIGHVDGSGRIYAERLGPDEFIGWINYDEGEVYNADDELMGWIEDDGTVVAAYEDEEVSIGYVTEEGQLYMYGDEEDDLYVGKVGEMEDMVEGAAALLFFFDEEVDEPDGLEGLDGD
jgi:hypothetical protein